MVSRSTCCGRELGRSSLAPCAPRSILDFIQKQTLGSCVGQGVLIHINPDALPQVLRQVGDRQWKILLVAGSTTIFLASGEFPTAAHRPLFKARLAGEISGPPPEMGLVDYGFAIGATPTSRKMTSPGSSWRSEANMLLIADSV